VGARPHSSCRALRGSCPDNEYTVRTGRERHRRVQIMRTPTGTILHRRGLHLLFASLLSAALPAFAGIADIITSDGSATRIEYASQPLRVTNHTADAPVMILRDGRVYMVQNTGGTPMVIDASQALSMFGNAASQMSPEMLATEVISLTATGARET